MPQFVQRAGKTAVILTAEEVCFAALSYLAAQCALPVELMGGCDAKLEEPDEHTWEVVLVAK